MNKDDLKAFRRLNEGHGDWTLAGSKNGWHVPDFALDGPEDLDEFAGPLDGSVDRGDPLTTGEQDSAWARYGMKAPGFAPPSWALDKPKKLSESKLKVFTGAAPRAVAQFRDRLVVLMKKALKAPAEKGGSAAVDRMARADILKYVSQVDGSYVKRAYLVLHPGTTWDERSRGRIDFEPPSSGAIKHVEKAWQDSVRRDSKAKALAQAIYDSQAG